MATAYPSIEKLRQILVYDENTGLLTWQKRDESSLDASSVDAWNKRYAGLPAFDTPITGGYLCGKINGKKLLSHRVAYAIFWGVLPDVTDHINGIRTDNRIANLRSVSVSENGRNQRKHRSNTSGFTGVRYNGSKWRAQITAESRVIYLGAFAEMDDAIAARKAAEIKFGFHPTHGRSA